MPALDIAVRDCLDANAAQAVKFAVHEYRESAAIGIVYPSATISVVGKNGQRRQKRRASEAVKSVLLWQTAPKPLWLQHLWRLLPSVEAKVRQKTSPFKPGKPSNKPAVAR